MDLQELFGAFGKKTSKGWLTPAQPSESEQSSGVEQLLQSTTNPTNGTSEAEEPAINVAGPSYFGAEQPRTNTANGTSEAEEPEINVAGPSYFGAEQPRTNPANGTSEAEEPEINVAGPSYFGAEQPLQPRINPANGTSEAEEPEINVAGPSQPAGHGNVAVAPTVEQSIDSSMALVARHSAQNVYPFSRSMWPNKRVWQYMTLPFTITSAYQDMDNYNERFRNGSSYKVAKYLEAKWEVDKALRCCESRKLRCCEPRKPGPSRKEMLYPKEMCPYINNLYSKGKSKLPKRLGGPRRNAASTSRMICPAEEQTACPAEAQSAMQANVCKQNALKMIFKRTNVTPNYAIEEATTSRNAIVLGEPPRKEIAPICRPWEQNSPRRGSAADARLFKVPKPVKAARPPRGAWPHISHPRAGWPLHTFKPPQLYGDPRVFTLAIRKNGEVPEEPLNLKVVRHEKTELSQGHISEKASKKNTCLKRKAQPSAGPAAKVLKSAHRAEKTNNVKKCPKILIAKDKTVHNKDVWTIREKVGSSEESHTDVQQESMPKAPADAQKSVKVQIDLSRIFGASKMFVAKEKPAVNKKIRTIEDLAVCVEPAASDDSLDIQDVSDGVTEPNADYWIKKEALEIVAPTADPAGLIDNAAASSDAEFSNRCSVIKVAPRKESVAEAVTTSPLEEAAGPAPSSCTSAPKEDLSNFWLFEIASQEPARLVEKETTSGSTGNAANAHGVTHAPCAYQEELLRSLSIDRIRRLMKLHETLINLLGGAEAMPERKNELDAFSRELILELVRRQYKVRDEAVPHLRVAIMRCLRTDPAEKDDEIIKKLLQRKRK